MRTTNN